MKESKKGANKSTNEDNSSFEQEVRKSVKKRKRDYSVETLHQEQQEQAADLYEPMHLDFLPRLQYLVNYQNITPGLEVGQEVPLQVMMLQPKKLLHVGLRTITLQTQITRWPAPLIKW